MADSDDDVVVLKETGVVRMLSAFGLARPDAAARRTR
jgi:hypothetical protein